MESKEINKLLSDNWDNIEEYLDELPEFKSEGKNLDIKNLVTLAVNDYSDLYDEVGHIDDENSKLIREIEELQEEIEDKERKINSLSSAPMDNLWWDELMEKLNLNSKYINPQEVLDFLEFKGWVKL